MSRPEHSEPPPHVVTAAKALAHLQEVVQRRPLPLFVAIDGPGGAGKSTLAAMLAASLTGCAVAVVHADDFARPSVPGWDRARFHDQVVRPLLAGDPARYQRWDWQTDRGSEWVGIDPGSLVITEGVATTHTDLRVDWALTIWVETPRETRLARGVARDGEPLRSAWTDVWMPEEDAYVAEHHPQRHVDVVVRGDVAP